MSTTEQGEEGGVDGMTIPDPDKEAGDLLKKMDFL